MLLRPPNEQIHSETTQNRRHFFLLSATRFYCKVATSSPDLKNNVPLNAPNAHIAIFTDIFELFCLVLKKNCNHNPSFLRWCTVHSNESKVAIEQSNTHLFLSICITGMKTEVTSLVDINIDILYSYSKLFCLNL